VRRIGRIKGQQVRRIVSAVALVVAAALLPVFQAGAQSVSGVTASDNVTFLGNFPETQGISGEFSATGDFFYVSSLDSISVFDISNPRAPRLQGTLANLVFENEAMTYGERMVDGELQRFVLVGNDLYNATVQPNGQVQRGRIGGGEVLVVDVTDPTTPRVRGRTSVRTDGQPVPMENRVLTSTHTVQCVTVSCELAYTAGDTGKFSIIDLSDLNNPFQTRTAASPAAKSSFDAGHYWDFDPNGIGWHTGGGGIAAFDVTDPLDPVLLNSSNEDGTSRSDNEFNNFILHNSMRPNAESFRGDPQAPARLAAGNVAVVTEEDYYNFGDELVCSQAGSIETWYIPDLEPAANPDADSGSGTIRPLDRLNPVEVGSGIDSPVGGFCSAHWFDYHQSGIIAQGFYQQGMRLIDVRNPEELSQYGYFTTGASEVWDAYWVPERDESGARTGRKTNVLYTVDAVRGMDVLEVELPEEIVADAPPGEQPQPQPQPTSSPQPSPRPSDSSQPSDAPEPQPSDDEVTVVRTSGASRVDTAIGVSQASRPDGAQTVVLARADTYPDALAGGPLAAQLDAPMLLTGTDSLDARTAEEVRRLGATNAVLLGGTAALSDRVEQELRAQTGVTSVDRVGAANRFGTAVAIADRVGGEEVFVTEGGGATPEDGWPDALAVAPLAGRLGQPILLAVDASLPPETAAELNGRPAATIVGGTASISSEVQAQIDERVGTVDRVAGENRYATAAEVARRADAEGLSVTSVWAASGSVFADALVAGPAVAADRGVLLLVDPSDLDQSAATRTYLEEVSGSVDRLTIVGGEQAVSARVQDQMREALER